MKLTKVILLSLGMALCAGGAVGAAIAFDQNAKTIANQDISGEKAVQLYWGHNASEASIENITDLKAYTPQYRYLDVSPQTTKTVSGTVTLTFTLAKKGDHGVLKGLTVKVYEIAEAQKNAENIEAICEAKTAAPSLAPTDAQESISGSTSFTVAPLEVNPAAHETKKFYAIRVESAGKQLAEGEVLSATLTVSQAFADANA